MSDRASTPASMNTPMRMVSRDLTHSIFEFQKIGANMRYLQILFFALSCGLAGAQVVKCKDATGKVIYSDVACPIDFKGAAVNLSGGNITDSQIQAAQERSAVRGNGGGEACSLLRDRAQQAFNRYQEIRNVNSSNASLQALENLASYCPSAGTCDLIKSRVQDAQIRFDEVKNRNAANGLDSAMGLMGKFCNGGGSAKQVANDQAPSGQPPATTATTNAGRVPYTKNEFGVLVRSDTCFKIKNEFGVLVSSPGCRK